MHVLEVMYHLFTDTLCILNHLNTRGVFILVSSYYLFAAALEDEEDDFRSEDEEADSDDSLEVTHNPIKWYMYVLYKLTVQ